jgi:hypothetical protein
MSIFDDDSPSKTGPSSGGGGGIVVEWTAPNRKKWPCYEILHMLSDFARYFFSDLSNKKRIWDFEEENMVDIYDKFKSESETSLVSPRLRKEHNIKINLK